MRNTEDLLHAVSQKERGSCFRCKSGETGKFNYENTPLYIPILHFYMSYCRNFSTNWVFSLNFNRVLKGFKLVFEHQKYISLLNAGRQKLLESFCLLIDNDLKQWQISISRQNFIMITMFERVTILYY